MDEEIVFYHNPQSRARIVHWMLEEVVATYRIEPIDFSKGENKTPQFLAINPMGKLPVIVHGDEVVTEAAAICAYLADAYPESSLAPRDGDPLKGTYYRWMFFGAGCVEPAFIDVLQKRPPAPAMALGYGSLEDVLNALRGALTAAPYLTGEAFSAADVYVGSQLQWGSMVGVPGIAGDPVFTAYIKRITDRPAYQRAAAQDIAALAPK